MAMARYHSRFDNERYRTAIEGRSINYANALTDEALAICGHPYYRLSRRYCSAAARAFLEVFSR